MKERRGSYIYPQRLDVTLNKDRKVFGGFGGQKTLNSKVKPSDSFNGLNGVGSRDSGFGIRE